MGLLQAVHQAVVSGRMSEPEARAIHLKALASKKRALVPLAIRVLETDINGPSVLANDINGPQEPTDEPAKPVEARPKKITKKSKKKEQSMLSAEKRHKQLMKTSPDYRHAYLDTRAMQEPGRKVGTATRARLTERASVSAFAPGGIMGAVHGKPHAARSVRDLPEADALAVRGGFNGEESLRAARAVLPGNIQTHTGRMFISSMAPEAAPQSLAQAQHDRDAAKARAGGGK